MAEKPSVLIIGGLGYIGRFLALHIHNQNLASEVRVVDKVLPQLAWLAPEFDEACAGDKFIQADASRERECPPQKNVLVLVLIGNPVSMQLMLIGNPRAQKPWPESSTEKMASNSTTSSTAVARLGTHRRTKCTSCGRWACPWP